MKIEELDLCFFVRWWILHCAGPFWQGNTLGDLFCKNICYYIFISLISQLDVFCFYKLSDEIMLDFIVFSAIVMCKFLDNHNA